MVVGAKVCELTEDILWFVCGLYVGILTSSLRQRMNLLMMNVFLEVIPSCFSFGMVLNRQLDPCTI